MEMHLEKTSMLFGYPDWLMIKPTCLVGLHGRLMGSTKGRVVSHSQKEALKESKQYTGRMTEGSKRRLRKCLSMLGAVTPSRLVWNPATNRKMQFQLAFVTLTLPRDLTPDQERKTCSPMIKAFLQALHRNYGVKNYVWRAERTKRGRIHYHIAIDQPVHHQHVRNIWNRQLRLNGLLDAYAKEHGHYNAPSTEIKRARSGKSAAAYMAKYMSKGEESEQAINGRLWDASQYLKVTKWIKEYVGKDFWAEVFCLHGVGPDCSGVESAFSWVSRKVVESSPGFLRFLESLWVPWLSARRTELGFSHW
jgi:hypothetical protein